MYVRCTHVSIQGVDFCSLAWGGGPRPKRSVSVGKGRDTGRLKSSVQQITAKLCLAHLRLLEIWSHGTPALHECRIDHRSKLKLFAEECRGSIKPFKQAASQNGPCLEHQLQTATLNQEPTSPSCRTETPRFAPRDPFVLSTFVLRP